jgi:hypothetical protein
MFINRFKFLLDIIFDPNINENNDDELKIEDPQMKTYMCLIDKKIIIELDGPQHFRQISNWLNWKTTMHRDVYKIQQAEKEGYKVIHISQEDVSKATPDWLEENLITYINSDDRDHIYISMNEDLYNKHIELYTLGNTIQIIDL